MLFRKTKSKMGLSWTSILKEQSESLTSFSGNKVGVTKNHLKNLAPNPNDFANNSLHCLFFCSSVHSSRFL